MRALIATAGPGLVEIAEVEEPRPRPDEVVVAVEAFSPNRGETFLLEDPRPGWRPGKDVAGVVVRPAEDGDGPKVGQRVVAHPESGGWAERVAVPTNRLAPLPPTVSIESAAALPLAGLTALRLIRAAGPLASRRVLLTGASGGVGHYVVEMAAAQGAEVTVVTATEERAAALLALGAVEAVRTADGARAPFHVGLDSVGGDSTATVWSKLHDDGVLVWFGQASRVPPTLDFFDWRGGSSGTIRKFDYTTSPTSDAADLRTLVRLVDSGRLHPEVGVRASWDQTDRVIAALLAREIRGNAVLTIPKEDPCHTTPSR
jgi:NADPH:quinone reductase-like Zn-dependent oxidoreductase